MQGFFPRMTRAMTTLSIRVAIKGSLTRALQHRRQIAALHKNETDGEWSLTRITSRATHHYNPFLSADGARLGYHRCRCFGVKGYCEAVPVLEHHSSVLPGPAAACSGAVRPHARAVT